LAPLYIIKCNVSINWTKLIWHILKIFIKTNLTLSCILIFIFIYYMESEYDLIESLQMRQKKIIITIYYHYYFLKFDSCLWIKKTFELNFACGVCALCSRVFYLTTFSVTKEFFASFLLCFNFSSHSRVSHFPFINLSIILFTPEAIIFCFDCELYNDPLTIFLYHFSRLIMHMLMWMFNFNIWFLNELVSFIIPFDLIINCMCRFSALFLLNGYVFFWLMQIRFLCVVDHVVNFVTDFRLE
jgi:hypothetical protein